MDENWLGGGICLGIYAEATEYISYMQGTVTKHPRQRRRMTYEGTSYRDDDDEEEEEEDEEEEEEDDDDDDERPRCRPLRVLRDEADADDEDEDDEMTLTEGHPRGIRTP